MVRAFVAVNLAPAVVVEIIRVQQTLRRAGGDIHWVRSEAIHLTLKFLGGVDEKTINGIMTALGERLEGQPPLPVTIQGMGAFPSVRRPRVLWVGVRGEGLRELSSRVEDGLAQMGFPREERAFSPHVTLGRVRSLHRWERVFAVMKEWWAHDFGGSLVDRVVLYRSDLRPDGAVYTQIGSVTLSAG